MLMKSVLLSWRRHFALQVTTLLVLSSSFTIIVFAALLSFNLQKIVRQWGDSIQVTAYLKDNLNSNELASLQQKIRALDLVSEVSLVDKQQASQSFKIQMASYAPGLLEEPELANSLPESLQIKLKNSAELTQSDQALEKIVSRVRSISGVDEVSYGQAWIHNYTTFMNVINLASRVICLVLVVASFFIVGNVIKTGVSSRREEIEILELVGATRSRIRFPYIFEGAFSGLIAAVLAVSLNLFIFKIVLHTLSAEMSFTRALDIFSFFDSWWLAQFIVGGTLIGACGAFLAVRSLNSGWAASQGLRS
jgi:cell division transport system permease protein